eukprot:403364853
MKELDHVEASNKILDILRQIYDILKEPQTSVTKASNQTGQGDDEANNFTLTNSNFIKFKFQEHLVQYSMNQTLTKNNSPQSNQYFSNFEYTEHMINKINQINYTQNQIRSKQSESNQICLYKMLKCESRLVKFLFESNGLVCTDRHDWDVLWTHTQGKTYFYERLNQTQKINHFPNSTELTKKDRMAFNIRKMQNKYSRTYFNFIPETFILPDQFQEFQESFELQEARIRSVYQSTQGQGEGSLNQKPIRKNYWIVKPPSSSRGRGIFIIDNLSQVPRHENLVISRYIDNPLLLFGHKFDLRIYVVVTSYDPLRIYLYREGLVRFASEKYDITKFNDETKYSHLTNYSINKNNENFVQNENADEDDSGFKWSFSALCEHFQDQGIDVNLMWSKIYDVIIKSSLSIDDHVNSQIRKSQVNRNNCYELFGYDIILDNNLNPWLLEVNLSPSLAFESPLDLKIKGNLLKDTFNLIGVQRSMDNLSLQRHLKQNDAKKINQDSKSRKKQTQSLNRTFYNDRKGLDILDQQNSQLELKTNNLYQQLKEFNDLDYAQKDYISQFISLPQKQKETIIDSILEFKRRGSFIRIYPNKSKLHL